MNRLSFYLADIGPVAPRCAGRLFLAVVCLLLTGCSGFNRAWERAGAADVTHTGLGGRWEGNWRSDVNGHHDTLRCLVTPLTNGVYSAWFHARYHRGIFRLSFSYTAMLRAQSERGVFVFNGESDLGWYAGGIYRYYGSATATNFFSTYDSKHDRGIFQMTRPPGP